MGESLPRKTENVATNSTFMQEVKNFRTKTPAEQRVMRSNIEDLLHQLERTRSDLENERERKEQKIREARQHETLAEAYGGDSLAAAPFTASVACFGRKHPHSNER